MASFTKINRDHTESPIELTAGNVTEVRWYDFKRSGKLAFRGSSIRIKKGSTVERVRLKEPADEVAKALQKNVTGWQPKQAESAPQAAAQAPSGGTESASGSKG